MEKIRRHKKKSGLIATGIVGLGLAGAGMEYEQRSLNEVNASRNHSFTIEELDLPTKIRHLIATTPYGSHFTEAISKRSPELAEHLLRKKTEVGLVHLYRGEMPSVEGARQAVREIREHSSLPVLISADIEGGMVNHFKLTLDDLQRFEIPSEILKTRRAEYNFNLAQHKGNAGEVKSFEEYPLPSQEWLGRVYASLHSPEEKARFLHAVEGYGHTIAKMCEYVGINMVFGPVLDIVENIDGSKPDEASDRSYGKDPTIVRALANAYIHGFQNIRSVMVVPKHFVGNSLANADPHKISVRVDIPSRSGALFPYRDIISATSAEEQRTDRLSALEKQAQNLQEKNEQHRQRMQELDPKSPLYKHLAISKKTNEEALARVQEEYARVSAQHAKNLNVGGMMTSVVSNALYEQEGNKNNIPVAYSKNSIDVLKKPKAEGGFGYRGVAITDDLSMASALAFIDALAAKDTGHAFDREALSIYEALAAGNEIAFFKDIAGREQAIATEVARYIKERIALRNTTKPDLTEKDIDNLLKRVLDLKVRAGLLSKETIRGKEYYVMDPRLYTPSKSEVLLNAAFSNQWPWTSKDAQPPIAQPSFPTLMFKATKNFVMSLWRVNTPVIDDRYKDAESVHNKLILIDKSAQHLWIYDAQTRELEREYDVGIGKGGVEERRYVGDHKTPTGTYEVVQKRDDDWWKSHKGQPLPDAYGGTHGGMLVLAGQWHPEIAIHGSMGPAIGEVSNGCVRVNNTDIDELLHAIPIGTMVIITK